MPQLSDFDRDKLVAIFSKQLGIVARRQVLACAMTAKALRYRTRPDGPWQVVLPGVYANERGRLSEKQRAVAAFLYSARGIAITGTAATAWHGLPAPQCGFVDVLVPLHYKRSDAGFVRLRCTSIVPGVTFRDGVVSYVALDRAIADAVRQFTEMSARPQVGQGGVGCNLQFGASRRQARPRPTHGWRRTARRCPVTSRGACRQR